jgi:hypothetical protein
MDNNYAAYDKEGVLLGYVLNAESAKHATEQAVSLFPLFDDLKRLTLSETPELDTSQYYLNIIIVV